MVCYNFLLPPQNGGLLHVAKQSGPLEFNLTPQLPTFKLVTYMYLLDASELQEVGNGLGYMARQT